ncbi:ras-responsive element-binding protein 1 isoform X1 [Solenopsis invicta]|uniref:ras-responsive element-binding protein 1 isoform X1 n=1 Tax=Solenopsis invicta TaxID=13686 RepID=UPI00193D6645|nr:ras-responsive element-binding protein 1 isoform X1 [Solenopsis invicta]
MAQLDERTIDAKWTARMKKMMTGPENGPDQEQENETQVDAASPSSSVELSENGAHPCPTCPSVFSTSHELTNHLRGHNSPRSTDCSGEEDYSCGVCNKVLSSASSLDRHVLVHSGERPFKCKYCDMSFTTNGNMNRHVRCTHRMVSPNSCTDSEGSSGSERPAATSQDEYNNNEIARRNSPDLIDEQQPSPSNNRANKRKCSDEDISDLEDQRRHKILLNNTKMIKCLPEDEQKAFGCPICGQDFASSAILESHMERVHPGSPATCETCNQSFKNHRALNLHRSMRHYKKNPEGNNSRSLRNTVDGFRDLTFIDFSSIKFPTIARAMCERELHRPASGEANRFQCMKCLHAFPCRQAQMAHEKECKGPYKNKRNSNDNNNNNDISTNNNLETELDDPSPQPDDPKTKREIFFAVLDLQNKSLSHETKEPRESSEIKHEPKESKDLADIPSILSVSLNGLQTFPRSDASTPENNIKFNPNVGSSGSSGTCSSEYNEEEAQDAFTAEFRKMKLKGEFPCRLCTSVFPNLRALKGHNRAHMNVEPGMAYPCNMCPYTSTDKGALMKHLRSHNGDRPFECSLCNYAFTTKANCERHVKNRHGMISKEDVKNALIYHPSEDSTNENIERSSPRVIREDVRKTLIYPNEREEIPQQQIHYPSLALDCNPGPSNVRTEMLMNRYDKSDALARVKMQALNLVKRNADEVNLSHDLIVKSNYSKIDDDVESGSSDGSVSLVSDTKTDTHQRIQASPMNLTKPLTSSGLSSGEDGPLDLSMDVLDLSRKRKRESEDSSLQEEKRFKNNQQELYATNPALLLTQALLNRARESSPTTSLETLYANTIYRNFGTLTGASMIPPYFLGPHMFSQELAAKGRLQKELVRGLQLTGGGTLSVDPSMPSTSYAAYTQTRDASQTPSEQNTYANLINAQMTNQVAPSREKTDSIISSNDPVKMVLKNGVLIPKQKQRRYRTERPFTCEHCTARFTLRSNMERHIKQQHPQYWSQRPRGGHSTRGRPPASHPTMVQNTSSSASQVTQPYSSILSNVDTPVVTSKDYGTHPISDQVKYAILAQQLKANKIEDNDSDDEMVIDEESADRDAQESQVQREPSTSLLRDQLENSEGVKDVVVKTEMAEPEEETSEETQGEQTARSNVDNSEESTAAENKSIRAEETTTTEPAGKEQGKLEDGTADLASVSKLLDNASQQYQQFQPQYLSDEEGPVASTSGNNSGSEKSDSMNSLNSGNDSPSNKKKKKKKKSAYSMAPNRVVCPYCERQFPWTSSLRRHILTHTGQKPYQCIHCSHHFTTKSNCDRHLLRKHKAKANKMRRARNSSSPDVQVVASSSSSSNGSNTFSMRNVPERPFKCHQCPSSTFATLGNLKKHRSSKHRKIVSRSESSDQQNSPPQCTTQNDQSDYESRSSSMSDNMENTSTAVAAKPTSNVSPSVNDATRSRKSPRLSPSPGDVPFKCYLCDSGFSERQDCLDHIKMNHKRSYEMLKAKGALDMASMNVEATEDQMLASQQHHSDGEEKKGRFPDYSNRKVVCAFCMRRFWSAEDLRRHMRTHTGERPFECDICTRKFTLKHSMLRHRKKHESVDSAMYIGNSGDEENSPAQPPTITPRSQQHSPISTNTSRPRTQDRISLPTVAAVATADAAPCALMRYNHYDNMATLTGRMANDGPQGTAPAPLSSPPPPAEVPSESGDNDLISNLLGIREKGLLDKVLLSSADDAAKLLGVNHSE